LHFIGVGVNNLVSQGAVGEVGSLRDVENLINRGLEESAAGSGPELTHNSEEGTLSAAVGAGDHEMHSWGNLEVHFLDEHVSVGGKNGHILEANLIGVDDLCATSHTCDSFHVSLVALSDHHTLVFSTAQISEHLVNLVDESSVSSKRLDFLVGDYESSNSLSKVDQQRRVTNIIFRDLSLVIAGLGEVFGTVGTKDGQSNDSVADHDGTVLDEHGVENSHQELLAQDVVHVRVKAIVSFLNVSLLPVGTVVERDFLRMAEKLSVQGAVLTLEFLLHGGKTAEGRRDHADDGTGEGVPGKGNDGALPADEFSKLATEQDNVKHRLGEVEVQAGETGGPLLGVSGETLVGVGDPAVQVANFVVMHVVQVAFVEVVGQVASECKSELFLEIVQGRVHSRRGYSEQEEREDLQPKTRQNAGDYSVDLPFGGTKKNSCSRWPSRSCH